MSISRSLPDEWMVLANSVCLRRQVAFGVLGQLIGQDEQAVERRPQFVRHVGEELGLVLRGQGELLGLFFERLAGLFDFLVLAFDFLVLVGEQAGLFFAVPGWSSAIPPAGSAVRWASDCDCLSRSSVRMLASMVLSTMPMLSVN